MRARILICVAAACALALAGAGCVQKATMTVTINEDGTVEVAYDFLVDRKTAEEGLEEIMTELEEDGKLVEKDEKEGTGAEKTEHKEAKAGGSAEDAELIARIRRMLEVVDPVKDAEDAELKVQSIEISDETVHVQCKMQFKTLEAFAVEHSHRLWAGIGFSRTVLDANDDGKLRLSLTPSTLFRGRGWAELRRSGVEEEGGKGTLEFIMPGAVLSSTLPMTEGNTTTIVVDASKSETLDAYVKFLEGKLVITAEPGTLAMDVLPLDSGDPYEGIITRKSDEPGAKLPITDAEEDAYLVEPLSVSTTLVHFFPGAKKALGERFDWYIGGDEKSMCEVRAEIHTWPGRHISTVTNPRVTRAADEQGRVIKPFRSKGDEDERYFHTAPPYYYERSENDHAKVAFTLQLELPPAGAETIEELEGEIIVTSFAGWKTHEISDPQADPEKEIDLGELIPGAKLIIRKVKKAKGHRDGRISVKLIGPPEVKYVEYDVRIEGVRNMDTYGTSDLAREKDGHTVRSTEITFSTYGVEMDDVDDVDQVDEESTMTFVLRFPHGFKRERVKFLMEAVDLF